jgi:fructose-specific component phosphotransferase system IIB-like protein
MSAARLYNLNGERVWLTENAAAVAGNDLLNSIKECLAEYKQFHAPKKRRKKK